MNTFPNQNRSASTSRRLSAEDFTSGSPKPQRHGLIARWNRLTAIPDAPANASFVQREVARKSRMTSNVLFFFTLMVASLIPACAFAVFLYPSYIWLTSGLFLACVVALFLNRQGWTATAGTLVTIAAFAALTAALFSTLPFDETTLQGYDMYVVVEVLAVALLPAPSVWFFLVASVASILGTLFGPIPHTHTLALDLQTRWFIITARPLGTLVLVAGVASILAGMMTTAIRRAAQAELIAQMEHDMNLQKQELEQGIQQILSTHVSVANGDLSARAPLTQDNVLWQIARALNNLLVRFQRAVYAEKQYKIVEDAVNEYVRKIQDAKQAQHDPVLPLSHTLLDPLVVELQNTKVSSNPDRLNFANSLNPSNAQKPNIRSENEWSSFFPPKP